MTNLYCVPLTEAWVIISWLSYLAEMVIVIIYDWVVFWDEDNCSEGLAMLFCFVVVEA